jgi:Ca2+-binding RTX toxin-like protein
MATNIGTSGDDTIIGKSFADQLFGRGGNDVLKGMRGGDKLVGGRGDDTLLGGRGNDILKGNTGDDKLTGGFGADRFIFNKGMGKDVITDFDVDKDILQIPKGMNGILKPSDVLKNATQVGDDVIIKLGPVASIKLKNVTLAELKDQPGSHFDIV